MYAWTLICKELAKLKEEDLTGVDDAPSEGDNKMKAPPSCSNLPLDEKILNKALMLLSLVMSESLIKIWLQKVNKRLECEQPERIEFERTVREIQKKCMPETENNNEL